MYTALIFDTAVQCMSLSHISIFQDMTKTSKFLAVIKKTRLKISR